MGALAWPSSSRKPGGFSHTDSPADAGGPREDMMSQFQQQMNQSLRHYQVAQQAFLLSNIQRLITPSGRTKSGFLSDLAVDNSALFLGITETWCHSGVLDAELLVNFPGYSVLRRDRDGREGGGVCLFLRDDLTGEVLSNFDNGVCSLLVCRIHQLNSIVCVAYRPPDAMFSEFTDMLNILDDTLKDVKKSDETVILMGDFNFSLNVVKWMQDDEEGFLFPVVRDHRDGTDGGRVSAQAQRLVSLALRHHLIQEVNKPTHGANILDLVWTNDSHLVSSVIVDDWPAFTDHRVVIANSCYRLGRQEDVREEVHLLETGKRLKKLDFSKADWNLIQSELEKLDWSSMEQQ